MRVKSSVAPNIEWENVEQQGREIHRRRVFVDGEPVGHVVYVMRPNSVMGTDFGWQPVLPGHWKLSNQREAIRKLLDHAGG